MIACLWLESLGIHLKEHRLLAREIDPSYEPFFQHSWQFGLISQ
jgi:hypothetical protein